jgi:hypothetical protein
MLEILYQSVMHGFRAQKTAIHTVYTIFCKSTLHEEMPCMFGSFDYRRILQS